MKPNPLRLSFTMFFLVVLAEGLAFAVPSLAIILFLHLLEPQAAIFFFLVFILSITIATPIAWLFAKGSNWMNTAVAIKAMGGISGQLYGLFLGGLLGSRFFGSTGALLTAGLFFGLGMLMGIRIGGAVVNRLIASSNPAGTAAATEADH